MSNIAEWANCRELSFIESMTLQETEEQLRELYTKYYREATGKEPEIGEADPLNLLMKAFCAMEYQTMQMCIRDRSCWFHPTPRRRCADRPASHLPSVRPP